MMFSRGSARGWVKGLLAKWGVRGLDAGWLHAFYNFLSHTLLVPMYLNLPEIPKLKLIQLKFKGVNGEDFV